MHTSFSDLEEREDPSDYFIKKMRSVIGENSSHNKELQRHANQGEQLDPIMKDKLRRQLSKIIYSIKEIASCKVLELHNILERQVNLPPFRRRGMKTVVFSLENVLIYRVENMSAPYDFEVVESQSSDTIVRSHVRIRPGVAQTLRELSKRFEIVCYSSSSVQFTNQVVKQLDEFNEWISCVLDRRHNFTIAGDKLPCKDLRVFSNRNPSNIFYVDCWPRLLFSSHLCRVVLITPFTGDRADCELERLSQYLTSSECDEGVSLDRFWLSLIFDFNNKTESEIITEILERNSKANSEGSVTKTPQFVKKKHATEESFDDKFPNNTIEFEGEDD
jgi:hypothetical protein